MPACVWTQTDWPPPHGVAAGVVKQLQVWPAGAVPQVVPGVQVFFAQKPLTQALPF